MDEARIIAWIDGELTPEEAREVAAAVAARADQHRRVKARFHKAFGGMIEEAARMPAKARPAEVVSLAAARAKREAAAPRPDRATPRRPWGVGIAVAASLVIGIATGMQVRPMPGIADEPHALALSGEIAGALQSTPSGAPGPVRIALSFKDQAGGWCRSFAATHLSGVACKGAEGGWQLRYASAEGAQAGDYRMAGGDTALGKAIDTMIAGEPADAAAERQAIASGWK